MKSLLLTGMILSSPFTAMANQADVPHMLNNNGHVIQQEISAPQSIFDQMQQKIMQDFQSLHSLFTQTNAHPQNINQQLDQIFKDMNQLNQMMDQNMVRSLGVRHLPKQPTTGGTTGAVQKVKGVQVAAGDAGVSTSTVQSAGQMIQNLALPILESNLNKDPEAGTEITLFSSQRSYSQALLQAGIPRNEIQAVASNTGGLTIGNQIWIPLYNLHGKSDLGNVLTHELTHVVFNQQGIGEQLPTWVNEGMAWHDGMLAHQQLDPSVATQETKAFNQQVSQAAKSGQLLPLNASESDILHASYNVEWVDYLAVENLMQTYGEDKFQAFLSAIPQQGVEKSFQQTFGQSIDEFEQEFADSL